MDKRLERILPRVQKPARYVGGEYNAVKKDPARVDTRIAFCFPDTYEVGMSFLGEKILYELLNSHENWWCERAFMPWLDMKAEMERLDLPLYTMESKDPLTDFDAVGFTLQYELSYTNILAMLDLAHIPFYAKDRDEHWPLIVAGGPCACNSEPIADFFDVIQLGEGENQLPAICAEIERAKKEGSVSKKELLRIACGVSLCTAVMWVVFAALHLVGWVVFDYRVLLGGIIGALVAIGNFAGICFVVQKVIDEPDEKKRKAQLQISYNTRMLLQALWIIIAIAAPCFQAFAGVLPLLFPRVTIYYLQITGKYKPLTPPQEPVDIAVEDDPAPAKASAVQPRDEGGEQE